MPSLAEELKRLRILKEWSLRDVEEKTKRKVSNSYLSQLETGTVKEPSPNVLYALSEVYGVSYPALMSLAGYMVPRAAAAKGGSVAFSAINLSPEEEQEVLDFIQVRRQRKSKQKQ